jgi:hypothetical protein
MPPRVDGKLSVASCAMTGARENNFLTRVQAVLYLILRVRTSPPGAFFGNRSRPEINL